jgi:hypothetical protein
MRRSAQLVVLDWIFGCYRPSAVSYDCSMCHHRSFDALYVFFSPRLREGE